MKPKKGGGHIEKNIKTVEKAMMILEEIAERPKTFSELVVLMKSNKATIHRFVSTLENLGYISKDARLRYQLTSKVYSMVTRNVFQYKLREVAIPYLQMLANEIEESTAIATYTGDDVYYLDKVESSAAALRIVVEPGKTAPLYCVASGKLYLAHLSERELEAYFERQQLKAFTENTITSREALREEIAKIKVNGYALDREEWEKYLQGMAFPIYDYSRNLVAALGVAGFSYRLTDEKISLIVEKATKIASEISYQLEHGIKKGV